jgi:hypothetical protein
MSDEPTAAAKEREAAATGTSGGGVRPKAEQTPGDDGLPVRAPHETAGVVSGQPLSARARTRAVSASACS